MEYTKSEEILLGIGIDPSYIGFSYLIYALDLLSAEPQLIYCIKKGLLIDLSKKVQASPSCVESGMRRSIALWWENVQRGQCTCPPAMREKPSLRRFLVYALELLAEPKTGKKPL